MSKLSEKLAAKKLADQLARHRTMRKPRSHEEHAALQRMRQLAAKVSSKLRNGGVGGLPSSFVLGIMKRDEFACKKCGQYGTDENQGVTIHHKGGVVESRWLSKKGHANIPNNFAVLCGRCHADIHNAAREAGTDSSQVTPERDKGTHRDRGLPDPKFV